MLLGALDESKCGWRDQGMGTRCRGALSGGAARKEIGIGGVEFVSALRNAARRARRPRLGMCAVDEQGAPILKTA